MSPKRQAIIDGLEKDILRRIDESDPFYSSEGAAPLSLHVAKAGNIIAGANAAVLTLKEDLSSAEADQRCHRYCDTLHQVYEHVDSFTQIRDLSPRNISKVFKIARDIQNLMNSFSTIKGIRSCPEIEAGHEAELTFAKIYLQTLIILEKNTHELIDQLPWILKQFAQRMTDPNQLRINTVAARVAAEERQSAHVRNPHAMFAAAASSDSEVKPSDHNEVANESDENGNAASTLAGHFGPIH